MNKKFLSAFCASAIVFGASVANAAEKKGMLPPPPSGAEMNHPKEMSDGKEGFNKRAHKKMADKFSKDLGLSDEQRIEAKKIRQEGREKMKPLFDEMKALHKKMDKIREENMKDFEKILTPEQKTKLEKIKSEREVKHKKRMEDRKNNRALKSEKAHHKAQKK